MKETITTRIMWNNAAKAGLVLGLVCIAYSLVSSFLTGTYSNVFLGFLVKVLGFILWLAKFIGCIALVKYFMTKLYNEYDGVTNRITRRYGTMIAATSALICAGYALFALLQISPDQMTEQVNTALAGYKGMMDSNTMAALEDVMKDLPMYSFFGTLFYCFIFGLVLSAILSRNIPPRDPFTGFENKQDNIELQ